MVSYWLDRKASQLIVHGQLEASILKFPYPGLYTPLFCLILIVKDLKALCQQFYSLTTTINMLHLTNNKIVEMQGSSDIY